jgi:predicted nucleic acid-binding protein
MVCVAADTSALVSLGVVADHEPSPLDCLLSEYAVLTATEVKDELRDIASYTDDHACAAKAVLDRLDCIEIRQVELDADFPLDDGENAAVTLANDEDAAMFLCDEFNRLGLVHASLLDTRLVTTPKLLAVFVRNGLLIEGDAKMALDEMSDVRSWANNSYVQRARETFR